MVLDDDEVYGELYLITEEVLQHLDELEGYRGVGCENHYERIQKLVFTDSEPLEAKMYVYQPDQIRGMDRIEHGDWKYLLLKRQKKIKYMGYGSMMDDQRLLKDQVEHLFQNVIGSGVLSGYCLKITRRASDGGRADIVEEGWSRSLFRPS